MLALFVFEKCFRKFENANEFRVEMEYFSIYQIRSKFDIWSFNYNYNRMTWLSVREVIIYTNAHTLVSGFYLYMYIYATTRCFSLLFAHPQYHHILKIRLHTLRSRIVRAICKDPTLNNVNSAISQKLVDAMST